jgi:hypothetical protein
MFLLEWGLRQRNGQVDMVNKPQPFRQHHITRALRGAEAAGMRNPTVEVHLLPTGAKITVGSGKPDLPGGASAKPGRAGLRKVR